MNHSEGSQLWRVAGADYAEAFAFSLDEYVQRVAEYLDAQLK